MKMLPMLLLAGLLIGCNGGATVTATPAPSLSPTASPQPARTITLADNGSTLSLKVGNTFLLNLGDERDWDISFSDPSVVSRVPNITVIKGAQGVYAARSVGKTTLYANGKVNCPPGQLCPQNILVFRLNIVVE